MVVFDVDGVLTEVDSIWKFIHMRLGTLKRAEANALAYYSGRITYEEWARRDVALWRGRTKEEMEAIVKDIPLRRGAKELISFLKLRGLVVVALSAGLDLITKKVKEQLGLDEEFSNVLVFDEEDRVKGEVVVRVSADNKGLVLRKICAKYGVLKDACIAVGDSEVDIPMFEEAGLSVAFSPKTKEVARRADVAIYGDLLKLLKFFKVILPLPENHAI